ncbi:MAG: hypothetical protein HRU15_05005 [Planctomycetes bacterium]|nr:hypothetical protein [Planctomycetota bacterium]
MLQQRLYVSFLTGLILCLIAACDDPRVPMVPGQVLAIADMRLELKGLEWGIARELLKPADPDENGRYFWTIQYAPGPNDEIRVIFVNEHTQWAQIHEVGRKTDSRAGSKLKTPDKIETMQVQPRSEKIAQQLAMQEGSMIFIVAEEAIKGQRSNFQAEANRLNIFAEASGLLPNFSVRTFTGGSQLIYGWNGEHGIQKNKRISDWVELRTDYTASYWLDLAP